MVWDETVRVVTELFDDVWADRKEVVADDALDITLAVRVSGSSYDRVSVDGFSFVDHALHHQYSRFRQAHIVEG